MLIWTESFALNTLTSKVNPQGSTNLGGGRSTTNPRTGTHRASANHSVKLAGTDRDDLIILGWAALTPVTDPPAAEAGLVVFFGDTASIIHLTITWGTDGKIRAYRGTAAGTLLGTSAASVMPAASTYYYIEVKARLSDTVGTVEVRIDETSVLSLSGVDTNNGGTSGLFDQVTAQAGNVGGGDDLYVCNEQGSSNTDFLGAIHVEALYPSGNGATSNGVGSDGNSTDNYLLVDDGTTTDATDYVDFAATGDKDTYAFGDISIGGGTPYGSTSNAVAGVMVWAYADKSDAGARTFVPVARLSGTEVDGSSVALDNGTFKQRGSGFETKPGGGAWTIADVNSAEWGPKAST